MSNRVKLQDAIEDLREAQKLHKEIISASHPILQSLEEELGKMPSPDKPSHESQANSSGRISILPTERCSLLLLGSLRPRGTASAIRARRNVTSASRSVLGPEKIWNAPSREIP